MRKMLIPIPTIPTIPGDLLYEKGVVDHTLQLSSIEEPSVANLLSIINNVITL